MCVLLPPAVAVVQSLPIFDQTRLFSLPLPAALGHSLSFSYTLQLYLVLMFLGQAPLTLSVLLLQGPPALLLSNHSPACSRCFLLQHTWFY